MDIETTQDMQHQCWVERSQNAITFVIARAMSDRIARSRERDVIYWTLQGPRECVSSA